MNGKSNPLSTRHTPYTRNAGGIVNTDIRLGASEPNRIYKMLS